MIVGTAGHIDHGKTLLIKALTGVETDRLKEEKARGITIELGFAYVPLPGGGVLGFVDVPGHERFVHTMLAGAASIDYVMLVVAADDGVMPQTREHLQIIDLLGITDGVVVMNKADLADEARRSEVAAQIRGVLAGTALADADILPVSALTGEGVAALKERLMEEAESRPEQRRGGIFRMSIDRAFTVAGSGSVATGGVISGSVGAGDMVTILPGGQQARVRGIHAQGRASERGFAGERCAVNLVGIDKALLVRGGWLVDPARAGTSHRFDARLRLLQSEARSLRSGAPVHLHIGTSSVLARVVMLEDDNLKPGTSGLTQMLLAEPLPIRFGDRFVIRDAAAERTIGGGTVIDPRAPQRHRRTPERLAILGALSERDVGSALEALLGVRPGVVDLSAFAADRGLPDEEADRLVELVEARMAEVGGDRFAASAATLDGLGRSVGLILAKFHAERPELPGQNPEGLRLALEPRLSRPVFSAVLSMLAADKAIVADPTTVRLPSHSSSLGAADAKLWERIGKLIEDQRFRPPQVKEMAEMLGQPVANVRRLCKSMARIGTLVEVATDRFFLRPALMDLGLLAQELAKGQPEKMFTAAEFRDKAGCGRNVGIQILEYFDRQGLTLRRGDARLVVKDPVGVFEKLARRA